MLQYNDRSSMCLGTKEFRILIFCVACAVCLESGPYFLEPLVLAATLLVRCDSPRWLLDEFLLFSI